MEAQLSLKAKKNDRRIALAVYDKQLDTLDEQVKLGDTRPLWAGWNVPYDTCGAKKAQEAIPRPLKSALPDLEIALLWHTVLTQLFPDHRQKVITNQRMEVRRKLAAPLSPEAFYRCITEVIRRRLGCV